MFPRMVLVQQQQYTEETITTVQDEVKNSILALGIGKDRIYKKKIGIAVGSRGIDRLPEIVIGISKYINELGGEPWIFAAMGSHGGGTKEGQEEVLAGLGVSYEKLKIPVICDSNNELLGYTKSNYPVYYNPVVKKFDSIIILNRVKPHTDFTAEIESGLLKMLAIGIGNPKGCISNHNYALRDGYSNVIKEVAEFMIQELNILFGVAVVENWKSEVVKIDAVLPTSFYEKEKELLAYVKKDKIKLPVNKFDVLVVKEIGKNISGTGMDTKVVGRIMIKGQDEPEAPDIGRIVVLGLTEETHGNATGIGLADIITDDVYKNINIEDTSLNAISSMAPEQGKIPCVVKNDYEAIKAGIITLGPISPGQAEIILIKNTSKIEKIALSEGLFNKLKNENKVIALSEPEDMRFDSNGKLLNFSDI